MTSSVMSHNISLYNLLDQMYMNIALFAKKKNAINNCLESFVSYHYAQKSK